MNFFKKKRKQDQEEDEKELTQVKRPRLEEKKGGARGVTSLLKRVGETVRQKVSVAIKALTTRRAPEVKSNLFTTPAALKTVRYTLTPWAPFSPHRSSLQWRNQGFFELNSVIPVTESRNHEFKTGGGNYPITILPEHIRKYGTAFLNSDGGVLMAGVLDNGTVRGIRCDASMRRRVHHSINKEISDFLPKVDRDLYEIKFVPLAYLQTPLQRRDGWRDYVRDYFVIEIMIKAGKTGELYESGKHEVFIRREGSVQGPLNPLQIKDLVIQNYREELARRRLQSVATPGVHEDSESAEITEKKKVKLPEKAKTPKRKRVHISPIVINT